MIFTTLTENGEIIFNESNINSNKDRSKIVKDAMNLIKSELDPDIKKYASFRMEKEYKDDFLNGKDKSIGIVHISKNIVHDDDSSRNKKIESIYNTLSKTCKIVNKKLPKGYIIYPYYDDYYKDPKEWKGYRIDLELK